MVTELAVAHISHCDTLQSIQHVLYVHTVHDVFFWLIVALLVGISLYQRHLGKRRKSDAELVETLTGGPGPSAPVVDL